MKTRGFVILCSALMIISGLVSSVAAEKGDKQVRFGLLYSMPTDDYVDGAQTTELDSTLGLQAGFEFRITDMIGIEPGISHSGYDLSVMESGFADEEGDTSLAALTVNVNFHFMQDNDIDVFVGPTVGYGFWDDINLDSFPDPVSTDDEFLFGVNFGLDVPIGDGPWAFNAGLNYLVLDITPPGAGIGVSPVQVKAGLAYSF